MKSVGGICSSMSHGNGQDGGKIKNSHQNGDLLLELGCVSRDFFMLMKLWGGCGSGNRAIVHYPEGWWFLEQDT